MLGYIGNYLGLISAEELPMWEIGENILLIGLLLLIYIFTWEVTGLWLRAWWSKKPITLEWTKDKRWKFKIPERVKGVPDIYELDGGRCAYQVRREAVGMGPHKLPIMLITSEFPTGISPTEIKGVRFYHPNAGAVRQVIDEQGNTTFTPYTKEEMNGLYVEYPDMNISPSEFVDFQKVSPDPKLIASYAMQKEMNAKMDVHKPFNTLMDSLPILIPLLVVAAIAFTMIQDHSMALQASGKLSECQEQIAGMYNSGQCISQAVLNKSIATGGAVR